MVKKSQVESKEIVTIKKEASPLIFKAKDLEIKSDADVRSATSILSELNQIMDRATEQKEKITKPLNEALKEVRARYKPLEELFNAVITDVRKKMTSYQTERVRIAREEEERLANRVGEGKGHLKVETAVRKIEEIERPEGKVLTDEGMVKFRTDKKFEVINLSKLPIEYHLANEVAIRKAMKEGLELSGVRYYEEQVPINFR